MKGLENKVALITGAGSGIGKAIAQLFAQEGASVVLADLHQQNIEAVARDITEKGGKAICYAADVSNEVDVQLLLDYTLRMNHTLDILVNNAGVMDLFESVADVSNETWTRVLGVNLNGPMFTMRRAVPLMLEQGGGAIVNIASVAGVGGGSAGAAYTASKHALIGLTRSTAFQYAKLGIRCNAIVSGGVNTNIMQSIDQSKIDQAALGRIGAYHAVNPGMLEPIDIANAVLFLASDEARYINGVDLPADRGWRAA